MMDMTTLRAKLATWVNLGPLRTPDDLDEEMRVTAQDMGAAAAPLLAQALVTLEMENGFLLDPLLQFLGFYTRLYPDALADALVRRLTPTGPPTLVEVLGTTRNLVAMPHLRTMLEIAGANDDLLIAVVGALGDIGGVEALDLLEGVARRPLLSEEVRDEVRIALAQHR